MSQTILLRNWSIHVPSVARTRILPTFFLRRPLIYVEGYNGRNLEVIYMPGEWIRAQKDFEKLQRSIQACQKALESVPVTESVPNSLKRLE